MKLHAIVALGQPQVNEILVAQGSIVIDCQFCNSQYAFDKVDCHLLFAPDTAKAVEQETQH